jgi:hypothetical protein
MAARETGQSGAGYTSLYSHLSIGITLNPGKTPMRHNHCTVKSTIAYQQVAAQTNPEYR